MGRHIVSGCECATKRDMTYGLAQFDGEGRASGDVLTRTGLSDGQALGYGGGDEGSEGEEGFHRCS